MSHAGHSLHHPIIVLSLTGLGLFVWAQKWHVEQERAHIGPQTVAVQTDGYFLENRLREDQEMPSAERAQQRAYWTMIDHINPGVPPMIHHFNVGDKVIVERYAKLAAPVYCVRPQGEITCYWVSESEMFPSASD